jgi:Protein of unknown function (DUF2891)
MSSPTLSHLAATYARTIVEAVRQEYPNALRHVMRHGDDRPSPRSAHPAFYGCFDWHSAVEMHWALVRMLRSVPDELPGDEVRAVLNEHLTAEALGTEATYLLENPGWERPYGYGWALALAAELEAWAAIDTDAARWADNLRPLAEVVSDAFINWLPQMTYPERSGTHANSAFALARSLPYARLRGQEGDLGLATAIANAAVRWFAADIDYPAAWEPSGSDFLSPALAEAELIAALAAPAEEFPEWLTRFLPRLADGRPESLLTPALVTDPTDGQGAHLHGLNLYRAYGFGLLAGRLDPDDPRVGVLLAARERHAAASLPAVVGEGWMVEHWLACYAVLLLS